MPVEIPQERAGNLKDFAILYAARRVGAIDQKVTRTVTGRLALVADRRGDPARPTQLRAER